MLKFWSRVLLLNHVGFTVATGHDGNPSNVTSPRFAHFRRCEISSPFRHHKNRSPENAYLVETANGSPLGPNSAKIEQKMVDLFGATPLTQGGEIWLILAPGAGSGEENLVDAARPRIGTGREGKGRQGKEMRGW